MNKNEKIHGIIHGAATSAAAVGFGLAQLPGSDNLAIKPIQIAMICAIGEIHGRRMSKSAALAMLGTCAAGVAGRTLSQFLIGWIPKVGNVVNASTAFAVTEAIGWAASAVLAEEAEPARQTCPA